MNEKFEIPWFRKHSTMILSTVLDIIVRKETNFFLIKETSRIHTTQTGKFRGQTMVKQNNAWT